MHVDHKAAANQGPEKLTWISRHAISGAVEHTAHYLFGGKPLMQPRDSDMCRAFYSDSLCPMSWCHDPPFHWQQLGKAPWAEWRRGPHVAEGYAGSGGGGSSGGSSASAAAAAHRPPPPHSRLTQHRRLTGPYVT